MRDFSIKMYRKLLGRLQDHGYDFQCLADYLEHPKERVVLLRHDVDAKKDRSLRFASIEHEFGIVGTYYFRVVPESYDEQVIREIAAMGHEIGYHYEDMDFAKGDPHLAIQYFERHLRQFRNVCDVRTICMHGSPRSRYDNKSVWHSYDYHDYDIIGEPYLDLDFSSIFYLTDTGRSWNGSKYSVRDKVPNAFGLTFTSTPSIIHGIDSDLLPHKMMFTLHPQRWTASLLPWLQEKYVQSAKNVVKWCLIRWREKRLPASTLTRRQIPGMHNS